jgi:hypothetical protein
VGDVEKLFSKRAYRQMGLHERQLSDDDLVRLMAEEYTFASSSAATARRRVSRRRRSITCCRKFTREPDSFARSPFE